MLDLCYFKCQIKEELCGAEDYILKAIEIKSTHPSWASTLADMSEAEIGHATKLYNMCEDYYKSVVKGYTTPPEHIEEMHSEVVDCYAKKVARIKYMHGVYNS